ncbi:hypothetical protein [Pedobacter sp.]|jgi:hypothetical protein|uniref:hypothetical protein n=1 Tax=Pedobacter sp. TaxID=1411316 RepID=UPI002B97BFCC|nr:hypothetical protein [Pedobacter sp.]HWW42980.1 hypothetical protein [Pedobacter sp.]
MSKLSEILSKKTDNELIFYVKYPRKHTREAVQLASAELKKRNLILPESIVKMMTVEVGHTETDDNLITKEIRAKLYITSLLISFLYVGLGTVCILSLSPSSRLYGEWIFPALLITLPASFISLGIAFLDADAAGLIMIIQFITFLIFWLVAFQILKSFKKKKLRKMNRI